VSPQFLEYNCLDSACTLQAGNAFWPELAPGGFQPAYDMTIDLLPVLSFMQTRGIKVDHEALQATRTEILSSAATKQEELNRLCGRELNVNSSKDCQTYFYVELGIPPYYNEGSVTVDDLALQRLSRGTAKRPGLRQAKLVQEIRGLQKLDSTYLNLEFDPDGRMRCSYNPRGTKFGRLSSSKTIFGTGTNMQNLPQEFKKFLVADPGYVFWEVDKRLAEWVVVAYLANDANMIRVVEEGVDVHSYTASLMFGVDIEVVQYENKIVGQNTDPDVIQELRSCEEILAKYCNNFPRSMSGRQCGKKSDHGLNYDEGPNKFALINEIEQREATRIVEMYHHIYPGIRSTFHEGVKRQLTKDRSLTNCFSRKVRFMDAWGPDLWKAAYSMLPQSSVVDSLNQGMVKVYNSTNLCGTDGWNIDVLAQVHDSILLQVPVSLISTGLVNQHGSTNFSDIQATVHDLVSPNLQYNGRTFKITTDDKIGKNWGGYNKTSNPQGMRELKNLSELPEILKALRVEQGT